MSAAEGAAAPRFEMLGAAGLACDGDVCTVPAPAAEALAEAPAGAPDGVRRVAADG
ncbi:hypothetical protein [Puerhibacterium sp. TATVAM-FAB25]|uniref:hypothetical protein n=1 Tax=Puerhibacterium sp. TATVAM-FAB25 TaxID=3093699 RepID=UPI00397D09B8